MYKQTNKPFIELAKQARVKLGTRPQLNSIGYITASNGEELSCSGSS